MDRNKEEIGKKRRTRRIRELGEKRRGKEKKRRRVNKTRDT